MTLSSVPQPAEPQGRATPLHFVLGYAAGVGLYFLVKALSGLNPNPCQGQTVVALLVPLLLGPGGLGLTASQWNRPPRAIFGLGLVVASLFPALFLASRDIANLRNFGCAGGYVVISPVGGKGLSEMTLKAGETRRLQLRVGGFDVKNRADAFELSADATNPLRSAVPPLKVTLERSSGVKLGQEVPMTIAADAGGPTQQYTVNVNVMQPGGRTASGSVTVNVEGIK
ncbi:hypothetical protein [Deinococcus ruber]|uniref:Uncharacterized protein n=1 Tax=Deinococcus ruber TaxID=1848197 RepID=A0A918C1Z6_9DEIO|nr:hypothetical protein [Deinococcus ruber]GGR01711.1 hypothetical protein GCM10008957_13170 [Deinococcus ruber]